MEFRKGLALGGLALLLGAQSAVAEEEKRDWTASAELGYLLTDGNSDSETLNAKFSGSKTIDVWKHSLALEALNSSQSDERSAEKYVASLQSDYAIDERSYFLAALNWEKDRFSSFDYQASLALGYGYKIIVEDGQELSIELAPGYRIAEPVVGDKEEEGIIRFAEKYKLKLSESSTLDQSLSSEWGDSNTLTKFHIGVTSQVAGDLSMKVAYGLKHNSDVAAGTEKTDSETSVTLVYDF